MKNMKYVNDEIKALAFDFIMKKTKHGWLFQSYCLEESSYGNLMLTFNFSSREDDKVINQCAVKLNDEDQAKEYLRLWTNQVRKPYERNEI